MEENNTFPTNLFEIGTFNFPCSTIYAYTEYAGCGIRSCIPVNFGTAHGKL